MILPTPTRSPVRSPLRGSIGSIDWVYGIDSKGISLPAIGDSDGNRYTLDNESIWHPCKAEEFRSFGMRRVENLLSNNNTPSEDITNAAYTATGGITKDNATQITNDGTDNSRLSLLGAGGVTFNAGDSIIATVNIRLISGAISSNSAVTLLFNSTSGCLTTTQAAQIGDNVSTNVARFVLTATADASGDLDFQVELDDAVTVEVTKFFVENSTGRADTTTPSEYVASGTEYNANVDGVKLFPTLNGNTVNSNVVTEGVGANISASTLLGYTGEGAATELSGYSNDIGSWPVVTTASVARDAIGLTGSPNEALTVTDNDGAVTEYRQVNTAVANDSGKYYQLSRVAYNSSPSVYPAIQIGLTGGTALTQRIVFDPSDGSYAISASDGEVVSITRQGDFWFVLQSLTNNTTGNTSCNSLIFPAWNTDGSATANVAAQGSTVFAACELYKTTWSYSAILTTGGTTKTRVSDVEATLPNIDWSVVDAEGSISFELTPLAIAMGVAGIITPASSNANRLLFFNGSSTVRMSDGLTGFQKTSAWSNVGQTITVKARWGNGTMRFSVDGVLAASASYDGSFNPSGAITLFKSLTQGAAIKNLIPTPVNKGEAWL